MSTVSPEENAKKSRKQKCFWTQMLLQKSDKKRQLIGMQTAMTVNVVVDSECFEGFKILEIWQNLTILKRKKVRAMYKTGEMRALCKELSRMILIIRSSLKLITAHTYMNQHLVLVDELSMRIRIVSMKIIISSKEGRGYFVYCFVFLVYYNWTLFSLFKNCVIHGMGVSWVGNFCP